MSLAILTTCNVCGAKFWGPSAPVLRRVGPDVSLLGELRIDSDKLDQYMAELQKHYTEQHPQHALVMQALAMDFHVMLGLSTFTTSDPLLRRQLDYLRWRVHQQTLSARLSDENITILADKFANKVIEQVATLGKNHIEFAKEVIEGLTTAGLTLHQTTVEAAHAFKAAITEEVVAMVTAIRNDLEEPGRYGEANNTAPQASNLVM